MTNVEILKGRRNASGDYKVDLSRGGHYGRVSSEWFSRQDDEKYLSLSELYDPVKGRAERARTRTVGPVSKSAHLSIHRYRSHEFGIRVIEDGLNDCSSRNYGNSGFNTALAFVPMGDCFFSN